MISRRTQNLKDLIKEWVPGQIQTRVIIKDGVPFEEIISAVVHEKADLLIIAAKCRINLPGSVWNNLGKSFQALSCIRAKRKYEN